MIVHRSNHLPKRAGANIFEALVNEIVMFPTLETQPLIDMSIIIDEDSERQF